MISDLQLFLQRVLEQAFAKSPSLSAVLMDPDKNAREAYLDNTPGLVLHLLVGCVEVRRASRDEVKRCTISVPVGFV